VHFNTANYIPCAGLTIAHFSGSFAAWVGGGATVTFVGCNFTENSIRQTHLSSAVLSVEGSVDRVRNSQLQDTIVFLENCTFTRNVAQQLLVISANKDGFSALDYAQIYSDNITQMVVTYNGGNTGVEDNAEPLTRVPAGRHGINGTSEWFQRIQKVCSPCFLSVHRSREVTALQAYTQELTLLATIL
jgi:hypothetical protein